MEPHKTIKAEDLLKTSGILKDNALTSLSSALMKLRRNHDALFVFDDNDKYIGVINPYYTEFKSKFPSETKLIHCAFKPPELSPTTCIWDIAKLMAESKIYYLPVIDHNLFIGIVTINRVLNAIMSLPEAKNISLPLKKEIITISEDVTLEETFSLMKDQHVARLPVIDIHDHLVGIITRFDLRSIISQPNEKPRVGSYIDEKVSNLKRPLKGNYKKIVVTATPETRGREILNLLVTNNVGSVVIIDKNRKPVGIVSNYDVLRAVDLLRPKLSLPINLSLSPNFTDNIQLAEQVDRFLSKINKTESIHQSTLSLKTHNNPAGKINRYEISASIDFIRRHRSISAHAEGYDWKFVIKDVFEKLKHQIFD